jgi:cephalosporin hydroxylase
MPRGCRPMATTAHHASRALIPDVAIVTYDADYYLLNLLSTLKAAGDVGAVHVWNNASNDRTAALLERHRAAHGWPAVHTSPRNVQHGPALDALLREYCTAEWVLVLDADTEITRPFGDALESIELRDAAFVGQIQPHVPHLYAYLAHLLVNRRRYLSLPPFRDHGAPGIDYFRAVEERGERFVRFRWRDHVHHFGQGSLRRIVERGERDHVFYEFACAEQAARPKPPDRFAREAQMERALDDFLNGPHAPSAALKGPPYDGRDCCAARSATRKGSPYDGHAATIDRSAALSGPRSAAVEDAAVAFRRSAGLSGPRSGALKRAYDGLRRDLAERAHDASLWLRSPRRAAWLRAARRFGIVQQPAEAIALLSLLHPSQPSCVVEIGTAHGGSLLLWARAAAPDALIVSVDLPPWELDDPAELEKRQRIASVASSGQRLHLVRGSSHDPAVLAEARRLLDARPVDFLFIDGDHSYDGVARDFRDYAPLVRPGGIVAFHDIHPHSRAWGGDVPRFWREVREQYRHAELVTSPRQDGFGIGVIWV